MTSRASQTLGALALVLAATGCADRGAPTATAPSSPWPAPSPAPAPAPAPAPTPEPTPAGACNNEYVDAPCTFASLNRIDADGRPLPADAPTDSDGKKTFAAEYRLDGASIPSAAVWVRATSTEREALERHFTEHRQARCAGEILRAPCPPGIHVTVQVPAPPVGTVMRQP